MGHIDQFSYKFGIPTIGFEKKGLAGYAVTMFFTLSGFLITYLLILEREARGGRFNLTSIKDFYIRRVLRIWPIYFMAIVLTVLMLNILPREEMQGDLVRRIAMYLFFLPNLAYALGMAFPTITPLWSVGVEEQFYLIWPWIFRKSRNMLRALYIVIAIYLVVKLIARFWGGQVLYHLVSYTRIDCMAIGAIGACLVYKKKEKILAVVFSRIAQILTWTFLFWSLFFGSVHVLTFLDHEIYAGFFLIVILNVAFNKKPFISMENFAFNFIGKISYGIYVYHMIVIFIFSYFYSKVAFLSSINTFGLYFLIIFTTILLSFLSYRYFEAFFLRLKSRYTIVKSTNSPPLIK